MCDATEDARITKAGYQKKKIMITTMDHRPWTMNNKYGRNKTSSLHRR